MENHKFKYFLAANSCEGFYSAFDKSYIPGSEWRAFIIKGGPGTGKSGFMKRVAKAAINKNIRTLLCPCSSDPDSLDAVIMPDKKIVIMDGTPPHTVEPIFPGACEKMLNFGNFWNDLKLSYNNKEIIEASVLNKALHKTASQYLQAAGKLLTDSLKTALACTDREKTLSFAERLCRKLIPTKKTVSVGSEQIRFISGITPFGTVSFADTLIAEVDKVVIFEDDYGSASGIITEYIRGYALSRGYEIITLQNPFLPSLLTDHIIIPELSLAFATENGYIRFTLDRRRIHARRFVSQKQLHLSRERMKFNKKAARELMNSATDALARAKAVHDKLENYYIAAMDFIALDSFTEEFIEKLFENI